MAHTPEQVETRIIGWIGCVPAIPSDDPDMLKMKTQHVQGEKSASMQKSSSFDYWVRYCTAISSENYLENDEYG